MITGIDEPLLLLGAGIAGPEPGQPSAEHAQPQQVTGMDRTVNRDGESEIQLSGQGLLLAAGRTQPGWPWQRQPSPQPSRACGTLVRIFHARATCATFRDPCHRGYW
ncbi:hypothetical protein [Streptomyces sp. 5-6(2022)]|uniref:hypothetical protein n=1 Tax=Streptomyces sp. 5-6(2022) TaxID=2936510 RepID=UPI0023B93A1D|nr:hypothetical protein [Streptomyces sp. 5-6(2022)]